MLPMGETTPESTVSGNAPAAAAISGHLDTRTAATEAADQVYDAMGPGGADLVVMFLSFHHRAAATEAGEIVRRTLNAKHLLACTAEAVISGAEEREGRAGVSVIAMRLPGARITPWSVSLNDGATEIEKDADFLAERLGRGDDYRGTFVLADPFSTPITRLMKAFESAAPSIGPVLAAGGMASGSARPGQNVLLLDDRVYSAGAIGVSLSGDVDIDFVVSQGCRPIGKPLVVTGATGNIVNQLGGRPPLEVLREMAGDMSEADRQLMSKGVLLGLVLDEYKDRFGRGDFAVRNILGINQESGAVAVGDRPRVGQTVQFHVRDAATATEDLQLLLDAQQLHDPPLAGLLFTCNGRGTRLFDEPNHDASIVSTRLGGPPLAGFFAAGEIGPIGPRTVFHGQTASLALIRRRRRPGVADA